MKCIFPVNCNQLENKPNIKLAMCKPEQHNQLACTYIHWRNWTQVGMAEWNRIFQLLQFSRMLRQGCMVYLEFQNVILEKFCSIQFLTWNFWLNKKYTRFPIYLVSTLGVFLLDHA